MKPSDTPQEIVFTFLKGLQAQNSKEWMDAHKADYQAARNAFIGMVEAQIVRIAAWQPSITHIAAKDCVFRINRDVRFSPDKRPYKEHFGAFIAEGGRHTEFSGYYLHLSPGDTFAAGGIYMPPAPLLKKIRQEIDYNGSAFHEIMQAPSFKDFFGEISGEKLKTAPKGYPKDHPEIELLRLKSFVVVRKFTDEAALQANFADEVSNTFRAMYPLHQLLDLIAKHDEDETPKLL